MTNLAAIPQLPSRTSIRGMVVFTTAVACNFLTGTALACGGVGCYLSHPDQALKAAAKVVIDTAKTNIQQSAAIAKSMTQGDVNGAMSNVGKLVVEGECFGCKQAIKQVAGDAGVDTVEQMVTQGFIALSPTDTSMFITYDLVSNKALVSEVNRKPPPGGISPQHATAATARVARKFVSSSAAVCIVKSTKKSTHKKIIFAFSEEPTLKDLATGKSASVMASDLATKDFVSATAPLCKGQNSKKNSQESVTTATMKFEYDFLVPRSGQSMKYEMIGVAVE